MAKRYDLIVFDWDGTVMDSTAVIASSIQAACRDMGLAEPSDAAAKYVIGLGLQEALRQAVPDLQENQRDDLVARYRHHFLSQGEAIPLFEGAQQTIAHLHTAGHWLAVATGKSQQGLKRAMQTSGMESYFHATRTADQTFSKPHPAMLLEIMDELGVTAQRALMVGDTTHDLQMARNAGVDSIGMTHGAHPVDQLRALEPLALIDDFVGLRAWLNEYA
ncbi:putative phosphoglycolate phosphatase, clustered with ribosomal large subunit pseudouridine synthase C [Candidatus Nitrotoga sp. BS]|uniref:HAD-IA family hydrolase n=1 Tax=Candidatus Nitrotoga sp. BS TaxID=2890408 RepID=UPI001EF3AABA|nr:HAD-IA family hydrolase [Candidatus Nitrotoga sp. BS]CAH1197805.1 putative phosphoglycolate phosphatase, clustered with ribosomal large subunit pseudouridine synthase C [Candidatus Nitrotoga sp. BS]